MIRTLALATALASSALATPTSLSVWLPSRQETALLTPRGVVLPGGRTVLLEEALREYALGPGQWVRMRGQATRKAGEYRVGVEVLDAAGQVTAQKSWLTRDPGGLPEIFPTRRGPCIFWREADSRTHCLTPDLNTEWASFGGQPRAVTRDGEWAYAELPHPDTTTDLSLERTHLPSGARREMTLAYETKPDPDFLDFLKMFSATTKSRDWQELPDGRFLVCLTSTLSGAGCRFILVDPEGQWVREFEWEPHRLTSSLTLSRDGKTAAYLGSMVHLWDVESGRHRLLADVQREGFWPLEALLSSDGRFVVALLWAAPDDRLSLWHKSESRAVIFEVATGKKVGEWKVQP